MKANELVQSHGGVRDLEQAFSVEDGVSSFVAVAGLSWHDAKQAINDVESCQ